MVKTEHPSAASALRFDPIDRCDSDTLAALDSWFAADTYAARALVMGYAGSFPNFRRLLHALTGKDPGHDVLGHLPFSVQHGAGMSIVNDFGDFVTVFVPYRRTARVHLFWTPEAAS